MTQLAITVDDQKVRRAFEIAPSRVTRRIGQLVEVSAIDVQREMRIESPVHDGQYRASIRYKFNPATLSAEIKPQVDYAGPVEEGSRPHWVSVREGSPLRKWATDHGMNPFALQRSIARKGTKAQHVVARTFDRTKGSVERDIVSGIARLAREIDDGL